MIECFVLYLAGHNRPPHEVLFGNDKGIVAEYERAFVGMTEVDCSLDRLLAARTQMRQELPRRLAASHKQFLSGLVHAEPDWPLVQCQHAAEQPRKTTYSRRAPTSRARLRSRLPWAGHLGVAARSSV